MATEKQIARAVETYKANTPSWQFGKLMKEAQKLAVLSRADDLGNVKCVTCKAWYIYDDPKIQGGHFISRKYRGGGLCFHMMNIHPQCDKCNCGNNGEQAKFAKYLGEAIVNCLELMKHDDPPFQTAGRHDTEKLVRYLILELRPQIKKEEQRLKKPKPHNHPPTI